jgi:hypothetical protein
MLSVQAARKLFVGPSPRSLAPGGIAMTYRRVPASSIVPKTFFLSNRASESSRVLSIPPPLSTMAETST